MISQTSLADFQKLDLRIGTVVEATVPQWSHWVMKLTVDLGPEIGHKICFAGIMLFFKPQQLTGKQFPFLVNLAPRNIGPGGDRSEVMLLAASPPVTEPLEVAGEPVKEKAVLFSLQEKVPNGTKVK